MLKSVAITPDVSPKSYKLDELYPTSDPSIQPIVEYPAIVSGYLFGPVNNGEIICQFDVGPQESYLEKSEGGKWIRLCDALIDSSPGSLGCMEYDLVKGNYVGGYMTASKNCGDRFAPTEEGTYRLRTKVYAKCIPPNGKWYNVDPASCQINEEIYSPEYTITN